MPDDSPKVGDMVWLHDHEPAYFKIFDIHDAEDMIEIEPIDVADAPLKRKTVGIGWFESCWDEKSQQYQLYEY